MDMQDLLLRFPIGSKVRMTDRHWAEYQMCPGSDWKRARHCPEARYGTILGIDHQGMNMFGYEVYTAKVAWSDGKEYSLLIHMIERMTEDGK